MIKAVEAGEPGSNECCETYYGYFDLPASCSSPSSEFICGFEIYSHIECTQTYGSTCLQATVVACGPTGPNCVDGDGDRFYPSSPTCTPPSEQVDCDDGNASIHPGYENEDCHETVGIDENCNGFINCADSWCQANLPECEDVCDQDGDGVRSSACQDGADCNDSDGNIRPNLPAGERTFAFSCNDEVDNDCDNLVDCADSNCEESNWCNPPPPPGDDCDTCTESCEMDGRPAKWNEPAVPEDDDDGGGNSGDSEEDCCGWQAMLNCTNNGGYWWWQTCTCATPIVIDVLGNGFNLTNAQNGVLFDIVNNDVPVQVAWTSAGSDDAWLALDRNGNGTIDSGRELFGSASPQPYLQQGETKHGFRALANFDRVDRGGNGDGKINHYDAVFVDLRLWQDVNHNGISEPSELHGLSDLGLRSIDLDYQEKLRFDEHGNWFRFPAKVKDHQGHQLGRWAWDVFPRVAE